jgi:hypothetical protein
MAQAESNHSTKPAEPFRRACDMENPLVGIRNFAAALAMIAEGMNDQDVAVVIQELAWGIRDRLRQVEKSHQYFFQLHHHERDRLSEKVGRRTVKAEIGTDHESN